MPVILILYMQKIHLHYIYYDKVVHGKVKIYLTTNITIDCIGSGPSGCSHDGTTYDGISLYNYHGINNININFNIDGCQICYNPFDCIDSIHLHCGHPDYYMIDQLLPKIDNYDKQQM